MEPQPTLTTVEILRKALEKEKKARDFYAGLASNCSVVFVRELLEKLQNEESKHIRMIRAMLGKIESS